MKHAIREGDYVRVKQSGGGVGDTRYEVVSIGFGTDCIIREIGIAPNGHHYAGQDFDLSLLVVDNSGPKLLTDLVNGRS